MSDLPTINPCRLTGSPARLQFREEFHKDDTQEKHLERYGLLPHAPQIMREAAAIGKDFHKEHPGKLSMGDFRVVAEKGQNATGWKHSVHHEETGPNPSDALKDALEVQRQKMIVDCIHEWNEANPKE